MGVFKLCSFSDKLWSYMVYNSSRKWALYFLCGLAQKVINNRSVACLPTKENWRIDRVCKELRKYKKKKKESALLTLFYFIFKKSRISTYQPQDDYILCVWLHTLGKKWLNHVQLSSSYNDRITEHLSLSTGYWWIEYLSFGLWENEAHSITMIWNFFVDVLG